MADFAGAAAAIEARLESSKPAGLLVAWPNRKRPKATDEQGLPIAWAYAEVVGTGAEIRGIGVPGDHVVVEDGLIMVTVYVPAGEGTALGFALAGQIGEIFRAKEFFQDGPGVCVRSWTPRISGGGAGDDNGMWFAVVVTIPFEFWRRA